MTPHSRRIILIVTAPVIAFAVVGGYLGTAAARQDAYRHLRVFGDVINLVSANYVEEANLSKVMRGAMRGLADGLDADSAYPTAREAGVYESGGKGGAGETGIELTRGYYLRAVAVRDGSPAAKAGLMGGDFLRTIDGKPTREMSVYEGARLLRGAPGSKVSLVVIRGNLVDPHTVDVAREVPAGLDVTSRMVDGTIGYVRIAGFGPDAAKAVSSAAAELSKAGAKSLLVDVRETATGSYDAGIAVAKLFLATGTIALKDVRGEARQTFAAGAGDGAITLPAVLLVNNGTSGAAEILTAAIAGQKRAALVGERTHGRAAVQKFVRLPDGAAMLVSNGWFLTPAGEPIHEKGLVPEVVVDVPAIDFGAPPPTTDVILQKGLEKLRAK